MYFAVDRAWLARRQNDGRTFYCPNGHARAYRETEADRLRKEKERLERWLANSDETIRSAYASLDLEKRKHAATRGQLTKTRKRAAAALCPAPGCKRHIVQMDRHLRTKHPDFQP